MTTHHEPPSQLPAIPDLEIAPVTDSKPGAMIVKSTAQAAGIADFLLASGLAPKSYYQGDGRNDCIVKATGAILMGLRLGLDPIASLSAIANVNGQTKLWGQGMLAMVQSHPDFTGLVDRYVLDGDEVAQVPAGELPAGFGVRVTASRKGRENVTLTYTWGEAEAAGYTSRQTYKQNGPQMLYRRAVARACERQWADVLMGMGVMFEDEPVEVATGDYTVRTSKPAAAEPEPVESSDPLARPDDPEFD